MTGLVDPQLDREGLDCAGGCMYLLHPLHGESQDLTGVVADAVADLRGRHPVAIGQVRVQRDCVGLVRQVLGVSCPQDAAGVGSRDVVNGAAHSWSYGSARWTSTAFSGPGVGSACNFAPRTK